MQIIHAGHFQSFEFNKNFFEMKSKELEEYTLERLKKESTEIRPLVAINGYIYDVSSFADQHPGGDVFTGYHGQDVTSAMRDPETHEHSTTAYTILKPLCVGKCVDSAIDLGLDRLINYNDNSAKSLLDIRKPLFDQLWAKTLTPKEYIELIHNPTHSIDTVRLFSNPLLEFCSRTPWYVVPLLWFPVAYFLLKQCLLYIGSSAYILFGLGLFLWTLVEYLLHRFAFHWEPPTKPLMVFHFAIHGVHHYIPMDQMRLVFPPVPAFILVMMFYGLLRVIFPHAIAIGLLSGGVCGYVLYDCAHYWLHHGLEWSMKKYHIDHHYKNAEAGYGVTSTLWDHIFGTYPPTEKQFVI
jgi:4-hydroxysphinganine ceramide fatty acyl 2-hydroxylase